MRLLDLFCGSGGAAMGYHRAGFEIVGVDIERQKRYPFEFIQADVFTLPGDFLRQFDVIHASPPCQHYSITRFMPVCREKQYPDLIGRTRTLLQETGKLYVIENVPGSPLRPSIVLCGSMFGLSSSPERYLRRHRLFECGSLLLQPSCQHQGKAVGVYGHGQAGRFGQRMRTAKAPEARILMGMDWATRDGMNQAIPPAYTEFIGLQLMKILEGMRRGNG